MKIAPLKLWSMSSLSIFIFFLVFIFFLCISGEYAAFSWQPDRAPNQRAGIGRNVQFLDQHDDNELELYLIRPFACDTAKNYSFWAQPSLSASSTPWCPLWVDISGIFWGKRNWCCSWWKKSHEYFRSLHILWEQWVKRRHILFLFWT